MSQVDARQRISFKNLATGLSDEQLEVLYSILSDERGRRLGLQDQRKGILKPGVRQRIEAESELIEGKAI